MVALFCALCLEVLGPDEEGVGVGGVPVVHEDVVFDVVCADVFDFAHGADGLLDFFCKGHRGEAGDAAVLEADYGRACQLTDLVVELGGGRECVPRVALPPSFILPKRRKGTERVTISGVTLRITMTFSGLEGMSLLVMFAVDLWSRVLVLW